MPKNVLYKKVKELLEFIIDTFKHYMIVSLTKGGSQGDI